MIPNPLAPIGCPDCWHNDVCSEWCICPACRPMPEADPEAELAAWRIFQPVMTAMNDRGDYWAWSYDMNHKRFSLVNEGECAELTVDENGKFCIDYTNYHGEPDTQLIGGYAGPALDASNALRCVCREAW